MKDNYDFFSYKNFDEKWEVANQANQPTQKDARLISSYFPEKRFYYEKKETTIKKQLDPPLRSIPAGLWVMCIVI